MLHNVDGRFVPGASEGGHADLGRGTPREIELVAELTRVFGRFSVEHVISGPGLVNIYQFTHDAFGSRSDHHADSLVPARLCAGVGTVDDPADLPAAINESALEKRCPQCVEALEMFIAAYGAEAGNLALRAVATAGVYIGGGIAPKILPALESGPSSTRSARRSRWRDSSPRFRSPSSSIPRPVCSAPPCARWRLSPS